jgi:AraC-like DNA-binding protein
MDLIRMDGRIVVAGPDTVASVSPRDEDPFSGLRFRPGALPRLLGVPAYELRNDRVPLRDLRTQPPRTGSLVELAVDLASEGPAAETAPWPLPLLRHVTGRLAAGSGVAGLAREVGFSSRTLQRHCAAVYGYGPATLRRVLRFRRAVRLLEDGLPFAEVAAFAGYADQPHLHREIRELAGVSASQFVSGANTSTQLPSGSVTVA